MFSSSILPKFEDEKDIVTAEYSKDDFEYGTGMPLMTESND